MQSTKVLLETGEFDKEMDADEEFLLNTAKIYQMNSPEELTIQNAHWEERK
jgi:hypothetical protein